MGNNPKTIFTLEVEWGTNGAGTIGFVGNQKLAKLLKDVIEKTVPKCEEV